MEVRLRPDWKDVVSAPTGAYVAALFGDFANRATSDPAALLEQLCSLSMGRLAAATVGENLSARPDVVVLWQAFAEIAGPSEEIAPPPDIE